MKCSVLISILHKPSLGAHTVDSFKIVLIRPKGGQLIHKIDIDTGIIQGDIVINAIYNYPRCNRDFCDRFVWFVSWAIMDHDGHTRYAIDDVRPPFPSTVDSILIPRDSFLNRIPMNFYNTRNMQLSFVSNYYSSALIHFAMKEFSASKYGMVCCVLFYR